MTPLLPRNCIISMMNFFVVFASKSTHFCSAGVLFDKNIRYKITNISIYLLFHCKKYLFYSKCNSSVFDSSDVYPFKSTEWCQQITIMGLKVGWGDQ